MKEEPKKVFQKNIEPNLQCTYGKKGYTITSGSKKGNNFCSSSTKISDQFPLPDPPSNLIALKVYQMSKKKRLTKGKNKNKCPSEIKDKGIPEKKETEK